MITRRNMIVTSMAAGAGLAIVGGAGSKGLNVTETGIVKVFTDSAARTLSFGANFAEDNSGVTHESIPSGVLSGLETGVAWLKSEKGSTLIVAIDTRNALLFDEILREARVRILFNGEHKSKDIQRGIVSHSAMELPASRGLASCLPQEGAWIDQLSDSLLLVARRKWVSQVYNNKPNLSNRIKPNSAGISLATYVIKA